MTGGLNMCPVKKNIIIFSVVVLMLTSCAVGKRINVVVPDGSDSVLLMDFGKPFSLDPLPDGWRSRISSNFTEKC